MRANVVWRTGAGTYNEVFDDVEEFREGDMVTILILKRKMHQPPGAARDSIIVPHANMLYLRAYD